MSQDARPVREHRSSGGGDGGVREGVARRGEVSRGRTTSGDRDRWEGPNAKPRCRTLVLVGWTVKAANPARGLDGGSEGEA